MHAIQHHFSSLFRTVSCVLYYRTVVVIRFVEKTLKLSILNNTIASVFLSLLQKAHRGQTYERVCILLQFRARKVIVNSKKLHCKRCILMAIEKWL